MMVQSSSFLCDFYVGKLSPGSNYLILVLIFADFDWFVDYISNWVDQFIKMSQVFSFFFLNLLLLFFINQFSFDFFLTRVFFVGFLLIFDDSLNIIPLFFETVEVISNYIVNIVLFLQTWSYLMI